MTDTTYHVSTAELLGQQAFGETMSQYIIDPSKGGQGGYANDLQQWLNNQAYVSKQVFAIVLEAPGFFRMMKDPEKWIQILRAFFETHVRSIEGLSSGLEVATDVHPVGGAGEEQEEITNVTRAKSSPNVTVIDKLGRPFQNFLRCWIQYGMMDPDTKVALASNLAEAEAAPWTADMYTATVIFIEPDPTHKRVEKAWLCTNMFPKGNGEETGRRDLTSPGELLTLSIEMSALTQTGVGPRALGQVLLDGFNKTGANPYLRQAFIDRQNEDVAAAGAHGYPETHIAVADQATAVIPPP